MYKLPDRSRLVEYCRIHFLEEHVSQRSEMELKMTENEKLFSKRVYLFSYADIFLRQSNVLDETSLHN